MRCVPPPSAHTVGQNQSTPALLNSSVTVAPQSSHVQCCVGEGYQLLAIFCNQYRFVACNYWPRHAAGCSRCSNFDSRTMLVQHGLFIRMRVFLSHGKSSPYPGTCPRNPRDREKDVWSGIFFPSLNHFTQAAAVAARNPFSRLDTVITSYVHDLRQPASEKKYR